MRAVYVDPAWKKGNDPRHDIAFLRMAPQTRGGHPVNIEDVTGAFTLGTAPVPGTAVTVTGYKIGTDDAPLVCHAPTTLTDGYPTVACNGFRSGTSGGTSQRPDCTSVLACGTLRASANSSAMAWSETSRRQ